MPGSQSASPSWLLQRLGELLAAVPAQGLQELASRGRCLLLRPGDQVLRAGDRWTDFLLLEQGLLRLFYLDREGRESSKNFFLPGQPLWPITSQLRTQPVSFFIEALEPCVLHAIPMDALEAAIGQEPGWTAMRLAALQQLLEEKMWREQMFLQCDAAQRYRQLRQARPQWCARIPLRHQASWLGITDVSLSRLRRQMAHAAS